MQTGQISSAWENVKLHGKSQLEKSPRPEWLNNASGRSSTPLRRGFLILSLLLILLIGLRSWLDLQAYRSRVEWVDNTREFLSKTDDLLGRLGDAETGQRGYLLTGQEQYLEPYRNGLLVIPSLQQDLRRLAGSNASQGKNLDEVDKLISKKLGELALTIQLRRSEGLEPALAVVRTHEGKQLMDQIRAVMGSIKDDEYQSLKLHQEEEAKQAHATEQEIFGIVLLLLVVSTVGIVIIELDILRRERLQSSLLASEQALRASEERLSLAQEAAQIGAWDWDVTTNRAVCSSEYGRLYGRPGQDQPLGLEEWLKALHPEDRERAEGEVQRALFNGDTYDTEYRVIWPDKSIHWLAGKGRVIRDRAGQAVRMIGVNYDVTKRKIDTELLVSQAERLREANEEVEQCAYALSHDLQEPLRTMINSAQLLNRLYQGKLDGQGIRCLQFIEEGSFRMQLLVKGLLGYAQASAPWAESSGRGLPLETNLHEALQNLHASIEKTAAEITHDPLPEVVGAPSHMTQVFQNLIANALKFHKPDQVPKVHISAQQQPGEWLISVRDQGIGFDSSQAKRVFRIFQRLHRSKYEGTGVGLAICKRLVEQAGGRIWAEGVLGEGAIFYLTLPIR